jgi:hypothetical protein
MLVCFLSHLAPTAFANTVQNSLNKTDILEVGMDMYSLARDWEISTMSGYSEQAFERFSEKVNLAIRADLDLRESFQKLCSQCVPVIQDTLDNDKQFLNYLKKIPQS